ncbi:MAG: Gfo/Idh/MocA family oxidoreductase [Verrucomicrobia bacterium]|nr:Gfo/Idh/MocA family oxidoreductase [Verrucomicrobiota bacterium]
MVAWKKKRFAIVGTGGRSNNFTNPIFQDFSEEAELLALCDISEVRMRFRMKEMCETFKCAELPMYKPEDFERMITNHRIQEVIVCSMDSTHDEYIVRALHAGCNVTTEKPMTTDAAKCRRIMDAVKATGKRVRVAFNYRWSAANTKVKEIIQSGAIGRIRHVSMEYALDTAHGADYFRRWHSHKSMSGGLLVHKSTHHFDLINWWTDSIPEQVFAYGDLVYYGEENALRRGDDAWTKYPRYTGTNSLGDPFRMDLTAHAGTKGLYFDAEQETGYLRDQNVFRKGIDIEDSMSVTVKYRNGMMLSYCLNAYSPIEGMRVVFHGERGRIDFAHFGGSHLILGQSDADLAKMQESNKGFEELVVSPHFKPRQYLEIPRAKGGHGGGDPELAKRIFMHTPPADPFGRNAGHEQGAASIMVGIAANISIAQNKPVNISELVAINPSAQTLQELV